MAATSLTYTVDYGSNYNDTYTRRGDVAVPDLSCYHNEIVQDGCLPKILVHTVAHAYGEMTLATHLGKKLQ